MINWFSNCHWGFCLDMTGNILENSEIESQLRRETLENHSIPRGMGLVRVFLIDLIRIVSGRQGPLNCQTDGISGETLTQD